MNQRNTIRHYKGCPCPNCKTYHPQTIEAIDSYATTLKPRRQDLDYDEVSSSSVQLWCRLGPRLPTQSRNLVTSRLPSATMIATAFHPLGLSANRKLRNLFPASGTPSLYHKRSTRSPTPSSEAMPNNFGKSTTGTSIRRRTRVTSPNWVPSCGTRALLRTRRSRRGRWSSCLWRQAPGISHRDLGFLLSCSRHRW